jgi:broad specificity phosphatase PhoE
MLLLVRHGRTAANASGLLLGRADPPLDDLGRRQADAIAAALPGVTRVIASPLQRAQQTAAAFGVPVETDDRWIELDYGAWDERPMTDVPAATWARWRDDLEYRPPSGETLGELGARVRPACEAVAAMAGEADVVVVTHVSPLKAAVAWALGVGDEVTWRLFVAPGSISRVSLHDGRAVVTSFNEVGHLT